MSWRWEISDIEAADQPKEPSIWLLIVLLVLVEVAGVLIAVSDWPEGKPMLSRDFLFKALLIPSTFYLGGFGVLVFAFYEVPSETAWLWNLSCRWRAYYWGNWTREHVGLLGCFVLTPEEEAAERMLGLEGSPPVNAGKVLPLSLDASAGASRMACALEKLLLPFVPAVTQYHQMGKFQIALQSAREQDLTELRHVMRKLNLPEHIDTVWASADKASCMDALWDGGKPLAGVRLVLACQLHDGEEQAAFSEMAVALLLAGADILAKTRPRIQPRAYLYRPVMAESDGVEAALSRMLSAEQVPPPRIKQFWFTHLDKLMRHAVTTAVKNSSLNAATNDVDLALGKPGHANSWVAQVLAAQMMQHGQGAQLIATPCRAGVALNVVGPTPIAVPRPVGRGPELLSRFWLIGATGFSFFLLCLDGRGAGKEPDMPLWGYLLMFFGLIALQLTFSILHYRRVSATFDSIYFK